MFCNIRRASVYAGDLEMGSDLVIFDDIDAICSVSAITLIRGEEMDHPETGEHMILSTYPFVGGVVPLGAKFSHFGSGNAVPDGTDLVAAVAVQADSSKDGEQAGLARWRRGPNGCWGVAEFQPIPDASGVCEPTLVRDIDGALLLSARGTYLTGNNQAFLVWRSEDGGSTWEKVIHETGVRFRLRLFREQPGGERSRRRRQAGL